MVPEVSEWKPFRSRQRLGEPRKFEDEELKKLLTENAENYAQTQQELALQLMSELSNNAYLIVNSVKFRRRIGGFRTTWVRKTRSEELLTRFKRKDFLYKIITGDENWVLCDNPKRRKSWVNPGESSTSTSKPNIHAKKVLLSIWWDMKGVMHYELLNPGQIVIAEYYINNLFICTMCWSKRDFILAVETNKWFCSTITYRPHIAKETKDVIYILGWEVLPHTALFTRSCPVGLLPISIISPGWWAL